MLFLANAKITNYDFQEIFFRLQKWFHSFYELHSSTIVDMNQTKHNFQDIPSYWTEEVPKNHPFFSLLSSQGWDQLPGAWYMTKRGWRSFEKCINFEIFNRIHFAKNYNNIIPLAYPLLWTPHHIIHLKKRVFWGGPSLSVRHFVVVFVVVGTDCWGCLWCQLWCFPLKEL